MARAKKNRTSRTNRIGNPASRALARAAEVARESERQPDSAQDGAGTAPARASAPRPDDTSGGPGWFAHGYTAVREHARELLDAAGPRELTIATGRLLGGVFQRALESAGERRPVETRLGFQVRDDEEEVRRGFEQFTDDVLNKTLADIRKVHGSTDIEHLIRLGFGLTALLPLHRRSAGWANYRKALNKSGRPERWPGGARSLSATSLSATGRVWQVLDMYGGARRAVIAELLWDDGRCVFLWDVDLCDYPDLVNVGMYDDVETATDAWRTFVGQAAQESTEANGTISHDLARSILSLEGGRNRTTLDAWSLRRLVTELVWPTIRDRPDAIPDHDDDHKALARQFLDWYPQQGLRHAFELGYDHFEDADAVAGYWCRGAAETWDIVSPHRVALSRDRHRLSWEANPSRHDYPTDHVPGPVALLPDWVRFMGERGPTPAPLVARCAAIAEGTEPMPDDACRGMYSGQRSPH